MHILPDVGRLNGPGGVKRQPRRRRRVSIGADALRRVRLAPDACGYRDTYRMEASTLHAPARLLAPAWRRLGSDETLVAAVRAGDGRAFEAIFDRYHRPLLSFCRHMLGDREEGEDALQQTFLGAYRDLVSSTKPIRLRPWLYTIARNQCLSVLRARRDKVSLDDAQPATEGLASEVQQREDIRNVLVDLRRLPDDQRAALVLAELGALSHEEIAEIVGCPRAKVKALVFRQDDRSPPTASRGRPPAPRSASSWRRSPGGPCGGVRCADTCVSAPAAGSSRPRSAGNGRQWRCCSRWSRVRG